MPHGLAVQRIRLADQDRQQPSRRKLAGARKRRIEALSAKLPERRQRAQFPTAPPIELVEGAAKFGFDPEHRHGEDISRDIPGLIGDDA